MHTLTAAEELCAVTDAMPFYEAVMKDDALLFLLFSLFCDGRANFHFLSPFPPCEKKMMMTMLLLLLLMIFLVRGNKCPSIRRVSPAYFAAEDAERIRVWKSEKERKTSCKIAGID